MADANTATISTSTGGGGNNNQVSYHLPAMGGLTAGVSVDTGTIAGTDELQHWCEYALDAGGAAVTLVIQLQQLKLQVLLIMTYIYGCKNCYEGISVMAS